MGKVKKAFEGVKDIFSPSVKSPDAPQTLTDAEMEEAEEQAAQKLRAAEKRRRGRTASILSDISEEEAQLASVTRPGKTS